MASPTVADRIVINTGPLIAFARAEVLEVVGQLPYRFLCPREVETELREGEARGHVSVRPSWLQVEDLAQPVNRVVAALVDLGEGAAIQLCLERGITRVCLDERKARRVALAVGLEVTGALGLLARAKVLGLLPSLRPVFERLVQQGLHYDPELIRRVLHGVGE